MPNRLYVVLSLFFVLIPALSASGTREEWKLSREADIAHPTNVCGFETLDFGMTGGYNSETHLTTDGGKSWPRSESVDAYCRFGIDIVDRNTAVTGGNGGVVMTTDGGHTWVNLTRERNDTVSFLNDRMGWVAGDYVISGTRDGGKSWERIQLPGQSGKITSISLVSENTGVVLTEKGVLFTTTDSGTTWSQTGVGTGLSGYEPMFDMGTIRFSSPEVGTVALWGTAKGTAGWIVYRTTDGGKTWSAECVQTFFGEAYISRDGKLLTIWDSIKKHLAVFSRT